MLMKNAHFANDRKRGNPFSGLPQPGSQVLQ